MNLCPSHTPLSTIVLVSAATPVHLIVGDAVLAMRPRLWVCAWSGVDGDSRQGQAHAVWRHAHRGPRAGLRRRLLRLSPRCASLMSGRCCTYCGAKAVNLDASDVEEFAQSQKKTAQGPSHCSSGFTALVLTSDSEHLLKCVTVLLLDCDHSTECAQHVVGHYLQRKSMLWRTL